MRPRRTIEIAAVTATILIVFFLISSQFGQVGSECNFGHDETRVVGAYPYVKPDPLPWHPPIVTNVSKSTPTPGLPDRIIVIAKLEQEDTSWVTKSLPGWQTSIHTVDSKFAKLRPGAQAVDKGRIANAYLTYLIQNYYNLPATIVFLNPHQNASPKSKNSLDYKTLRNLNVDFIQKSGYTNLRCVTSSGCLAEIFPFRDPSDEFRTLEVNMREAWKEIFNNDDVPEKLMTPCCMEFGVSREQVKKRGVEEYIRYWKWLNKTKMDDDTAGAVFEYIWHVVFGKEAVYCQESRKCECDVYGKC